MKELPRPWVSERIPKPGDSSSGNGPHRGGRPARACWAIWIVVLATLLSGCGLGASSHSSSSPPEVYWKDTQGLRGRVLYVTELESMNDGTIMTQIWLIDFDKGVRVPVPHRRGSYLDPYFLRGDHSNFLIRCINKATSPYSWFIIDLNGRVISEVTALENKGAIGWVSLSPDNRKAVFPVAKTSNMTIADLKTGAIREFDFSCHDPDWSPQGDSIIFYRAVSESPMQTEIFLFNTNSTAPIQLTNTRIAGYSKKQLQDLVVVNVAPKWNPKGNGEFAFCSNSDTFGDPQIMTMKVDGSNRSRITNTNLEIDHMCWSPDGEWLALLCSPPDARLGEDHDLFVVKRDGTEFRRITRGLKMGWVITWR